MFIFNLECGAYRRYAAKSIISNHFTWSLVLVFTSLILYKKNKYNSISTWSLCLFIICVRSFYSRLWVVLKKSLCNPPGRQWKQRKFCGPTLFWLRCLVFDILKYPRDSGSHFMWSNPLRFFSVYVIYMLYVQFIYT